MGDSVHAKILGRTPERLKLSLSRYISMDVRVNELIHDCRDCLSYLDQRTFDQLVGDVDVALEEHLLDRVLVELNARLLHHVEVLLEEILHELRVRRALHLVSFPAVLVLEDPRIQQHRGFLAEPEHHVLHVSLVLLHLFGLLFREFLLLQHLPLSLPKWFLQSLCPSDSTSRSTATEIIADGIRRHDVQGTI